jgi:hypothetical protein
MGRWTEEAIGGVSRVGTRDITCRYIILTLGELEHLGATAENRIGNEVEVELKGGVKVMRSEEGRGGRVC